MLGKRILSGITTLALCASIMVPTDTFAAASFTGGSNVSGGLNVQVSITDLQVTGAAPGDTVPVFLYVPAGSLSMTTTTGLTFTGASSGQRLYFSGTLTDVNAALATLKYTHSSAGTFTLEASIIEAGQIYDPSTQHIYEVVNNGSSITATAARTAATSRTINGVSGYLANITSSTENSFVAARISQDGWFGASDSGEEGTWKWLDGPESGTTFWIGNYEGQAYAYENWAGFEPNQAGDEDCSQFYANGSGWNDLSCSATNISTYIVEYGAPGNLPTVAGDTLDITLSADTTTQAPTLTSPTSSSTQNTLQLTYTLPEVPTSGSVTVSFNDGTTTTILVMNDNQSVDTTVNLADLDATTGVTSATAASLADGTYTVSVNYQDYLGNPVSSDTETLVTIDTIPPVISAVVSNILYPPGASITWTTNEPATSRTLYNNIAPGSLTYDVTDLILTTTHTGIIHGLEQVTTYLFYVASTDAAGNTTTTSASNFTTKNGGSGGGGGKTTYLGCRDEKAINYDPESTHKAELCEYKKVEPTPKTETESFNTTKENTSEDNPVQESHTVLNSAPTECNITQYTTETIRLGRKNNPEQVKLLEQFLNRYENAHLDVNGIYEKADFEAVIRWQEKYADDILKPWGLKKGTGYVYTRSLAKIKALEEASCPTKKEDSRQTDDILNKENDTK